MWLPRRLRTDHSFPRPIPIAKRFYWRLGDLRYWRDQQPRLAVIDKPQHLPPRAPKGKRWKRGDKAAKAAAAPSTATSES
jgi:hypothetical protein